MANKLIVWQDFEGGWSNDLKVGIKNSQPYTLGLDFRKSPSQVSVLPGPTREDGGVLKDLIVNEVMANNGTIYAYGNAGYLYKRTTAGVWSAEGNTGFGGFGMDYRKDTDSIYLAGSKSVSLYSPISGSPTALVNEYNISKSLSDNSANTKFNVAADQEGSTAICGIKVATTPLDETNTNVRFFQSDIEPLNKVSFYIVTKGTGDWTATLHDGLNNVLGTATVTNANLKNGIFNDFIFTSAPNGQVRIYVAPNARTYHIHLTSTVADGTVSCTTTNILSSCDLQIWADRLVVTNNGMHPMQRFLQYETFGNGNYLSIWEPISDPPTNAEWQRHALVFPQEYEVCGLAVQNEFIVVAAQKDTTSTSFDPQQGILFFWDGTSNTYNYFVEIAEGAPMGLFVYKNIAYYYAGGALWAITSPTTQPVKLWTMPGTDTEFSGATAPITVYPYAATVRRGIYLTAFPSVSTNANVNFGVYSWGSVDKNFPESFGYSYIPSTGSQNYTVSNNLQIGMTQSFGDLLHISWRDDVNGGYGVDVINNSSAPTANSTWNSLLVDDGYSWKLKTGKYMEVYYLLPAGATITMKYKIGRTGPWVIDPVSYSTTVLWQGRNDKARYNISANATGDFTEIQLGFDIVCPSSATSTPKVFMVAFAYNDNKENSDD